MDRFLAGYTDQGVLADWGAPREAAREFLSEFIGSIPVKVVKINSIEVFGDRATVDVVRNIGAIRDRARESLVKEGGKWRVDGSEKLSPQLPSGATAIDLKYVDYGFEFKAEATSSGEFALEVENVGKEPHEMLIYELPTGVSLESIFQVPQDQREWKLIVSPVELAPGEQTNVVLTRPLKSGSYGLVCFIRSPDGTSHAAKGMVAEFTVK